MGDRLFIIETTMSMLPVCIARISHSVFASRLPLGLSSDTPDSGVVTRLSPTYGKLLWQGLEGIGQDLMRFNEAESTSASVSLN